MPRLRLPIKSSTTSAPHLNNKHAHHTASRRTSKGASASKVWLPSQGPPPRTDPSKTHAFSKTRRGQDDQGPPQAPHASTASHASAWPGACQEDRQRWRPAVLRQQGRRGERARALATAPRGVRSTPPLSLTSQTAACLLGHFVLVSASSPLPLPLPGIHIRISININTNINTSTKININNNIISSISIRISTSTTIIINISICISTNTLIIININIHIEIRIRISKRIHMIMNSHY
ncbi:hypothetical protein N9L68_01985 [bacterium]|nr:hypothetical protein [bacterium]